MQRSVDGFVFHRVGGWVNAVSDDSLLLHNPDFPRSTATITTSGRSTCTMQTGSGGLLLAAGAEFSP